MRPEASSERANPSRAAANYPASTSFLGAEKRWRLLIFLLFLVGIWQILAGPRFKATTSSLHYQDLRPKLHRWAYVTLLCDDIMAEPAFVLVQSLKRTGTPHDVVVLTLNVSSSTLQSLTLLGAIIKPIDAPVRYPFEITAKRIAINKPCRYSKLLVWTLVRYSKIVYLDADLLILDNLDDLFHRPELSAVPDMVPPNKFNSGVMVLRPNLKTFQDMMLKVNTTVSPNVGDQGFLNSFFGEWYRSPSIHHLESIYNSLVREAGTPVWQAMVGSRLKVLHFSGSTKPWNRMEDPQFPTTRAFDSLWWEVYDEVYEKLGRAVKGEGSVPQQMRAECQKDFMPVSRGDVVRDKLSVVISCFDRFDLLLHMIRQYQSLSIVHKIYVVWGNVHITPWEPHQFNSSKPLEVLYTGVDNLNDRFKPIPSLQTEAVLICDDDVEIDADALQSAFARWQESPFQLVGFFPRAHYKDRSTNQLVYVLNPRGEYSMVLTKMMLLHADYLRFYTCSLPTSLKDYIERIKNCEDIAMNFMASQLSGMPPLLLEDKTKVDYGTTSGLSSRRTHVFSRSVCLNDIARELGYMSLRNTSEVRTFYDPDGLRGRRGRQVAVNDSPRQWQSLSRLSKQLEYAEEEGYADVMDPTVLCIQGGWKGGRSLASLFSYNRVPHTALHLSGATLLSQPSHAHTLPSRLSLLRSFAPFLGMRRKNRCFGAARILLPKWYEEEVEGKGVEGRQWAAEVLKVGLGSDVKIYRGAGGGVGLGGGGLECFERALVGRKGWEGGEEVGMVVAQMKANLHHMCRWDRFTDISSNSTKPSVRVALVGSDTSWGAINWFSYSDIRTHIMDECLDRGLRCTVTKVTRNSLCSPKIMFLSEADIVIGVGDDGSMRNIVFARPGAGVMEVLTGGGRREEQGGVRRDMEALGLRYEQMSHSLGVDPLLWWLHLQLGVIEEGKNGGRRKAETLTLPDPCVKRWTKL